MTRRPFALALALALVGGGCGSSSQPPIVGSVGAAHAGQSPAVAATTAIDPNFDNGQVVLVTRRGPRPHWLVAAVGQPITWINRSGHTLVVTFDHQSVRSRPIPPGGRFSFTPPTALSITYHVGGGPRLRGLVQVAPTEQSGQ